MRQVDSILAEFPGPVTLQPSRLKMLALFAGSLIFVASGVAMLKIRPAGMDSSETLMMWLAVGFFGLCAAVFGVLTLPGAASLTLGADGFELCNLYRRTRFPWADTRNFRIQQFSDTEGSRDRQVMFEVLGAGTGPKRTGAKWYDGMLPDTFGLSKDDFCALMQQWRDKALAPKPSGLPRVKASDSAA